MAISSERLEHLIHQIESGAFSEQELTNLYNNAARRHVAIVMEAVQRKMRGDFPRAAKKLFGAKEAQAMRRLEQALEALSVDFDFSKNKGKAAVKAGGPMLSGDKHVDVHLSYKNASNDNLDLSVVQDTPDSELFAFVTRYKSGASTIASQNKYTMEDFDRAVEEFRQLLAQAPISA